MKNIFSKSLALLLAVGSVLSFSSCEVENWFDIKEVLGVTNAGGPDLEKPLDELYAEWVSKIESYDNSKKSFTYEATQGEEKMSMSAVICYDGESRYAISELGMGNDSETYEYWYANGYVYIKTGENKVKGPMTKENFDTNYNILSTGFTDDSFVNMPAEWLKDVKWAKNDDDKWCASITVTKEEYAESFAEGVFSSILESADLEEINYEIILESDGSIRSVGVIFDSAIDGTPVFAEFVLELSNIGTTTVTIPADSADWALNDDNENSDEDTSGSENSGEDASGEDTSGGDNAGNESSGEDASGSEDSGSSEPEN